MGYAKYFKRGGPKAGRSSNRGRIFGKRKSKRAKRIPKKLFKKKLTTNLGRFLTKKVDTVLEKRIVQLIRAEPQARNLVMRKSHGQYDPKLNYFIRDGDYALVGSNPGVITPTTPDMFTPISSEWGLKMDLANIRIRDIQIDPRFGGVEEKFSMEIEASNASAISANPALGASTGVEHGSRSGDAVRLRSFYCKLRFWAPESAGSSTEEPNVDAHFAIVRCAGEWDDVTTGILPSPTLDTCLPLVAWNHNGALDVFDRKDRKQDLYKFKVLAKGSVRLQISDHKPSEKFATISYKFPKPVIHEFVNIQTLQNVTDLTKGMVQAGQLPRRFRYYLCVRGNTRHVGMIPHCWAVTYTNYYDK